MKYLLDTNVISDFVRANPAVRRRLLATTPSELATSSITLMEIEYGLARNPERARRIAPVIEALLDSITIVSCGPPEARETGRLRADLERTGQPIGPFDALIAGVARVHRLILVSANTSEFTRVPKLDVENWRVPG